MPTRVALDLGTPNLAQRAARMLASAGFVVSSKTADIRVLEVPEALSASARPVLPDDLPIVVCTPAVGPRAMRRLADAGADGIVWTQRFDHSLIVTVAAVAGGQICFPRELKRRVTEPLLTSREKQVFGLVVLGLSNGEIAGTLGVGEQTVKSHVKSGLRKLGATSRTEAAHMITDPDGRLGLGILTLDADENG